MKNPRRYFLISGLGFCVLFSGLSSAQDGPTSSGFVEVIIQGRQYKSVRAYKREQIKNTLKRTLSSYNLMEFSEDELYEIMKEVRKQQTASGSSRKDLKSAGPSDRGLLEDCSAAEDNVQALEASQMQEMLQEYRKKHKGAGHLFLDPNKVKSVIIKPQKQSEDALEN